MGIKGPQIRADMIHMLEGIAVASCLNQIIRPVKLAGDDFIHRVLSPNGKRTESRDMVTRLHRNFLEIGHLVGLAVKNRTYCLGVIAVLEDGVCINAGLDVFPELNLNPKLSGFFPLIGEVLNLFQ